MVPVTVAQRPVRVTVAPESAELMAIGQTVQLVASVYDSNENLIVNPAVSWKSQNVAVAAVDRMGLVTAAGNGMTQIVAASGDFTSMATITVTQKAVRIAILPESATLTALEETLQLEAVVYDSNDYPIADAPVAWSSDDTEVASVSDTGLVTPHRNGTAQITATSDDLSGTARVRVAVPSPDRASLITLYNSLGGPEWLNSENWLSDLPVKDWYGVMLNTENRVIELSLPDNDLKGPIPAAVGELVHIRKLRLNGNTGLVGPLPMTITGLTLDVLNLADTQLCAPSDADWQSWLNQIQDARVEECVNNINDLNALFAIYYQTGGSNWHNASSWLTNTPADTWYGVETTRQGRVEHLYLQENNLSGVIPPEIGQLSDLVSLFMHKNQLTGRLPVELSNLNRLRLFNLGTNQLSGPIPPEFSRLSTLSHLYLDHNALTGTIPPELGQNTGLVYLDLGWNRLTGPIPPELGQLAILEWLGLGTNLLSGTIPAELRNLSNLRILWLSDNRLTGEIPSYIGQFRRLEWLKLERNRLTGPIPSELGQMSTISLIDLSVNQLTGSIPPELGQIDAIHTMDLHDNRLSGVIPPELGNTRFNRLNLSNNVDLMGPLPRTFLNTSIKYLNLGRTQVCVPVDDEFQEWLETISQRFVANCNDGDN